MIQRQADWEFAVTATTSAYSSVAPPPPSFLKTSELKIDFSDVYGATQTQPNQPHLTAVALIPFFISSLLSIQAFMQRAPKRRLQTGGATHV